MSSGMQLRLLVSTTVGVLMILLSGARAASAQEPIEPAGQFSSRVMMTAVSSLPLASSMRERGTTVGMRAKAALSEKTSPIP